MKKIVVAIFALVLCSTYVDMGAKQESDLPQCRMDQCKPGEPCQCWCSVKGGPRDWEKGDTGVVSEGVCYCTEWDKNHAPGPVNDKAAKKHKKNKAKPY